MDKNFMLVLHEGEMLSDNSLDLLKGGGGDKTGCKQNDCPGAVCNINTGK